MPVGVPFFISIHSLLFFFAMAGYYITGVWKDTNGTITHYATHLINANGTWRQIPTKTNKADAIKLVETPGHSVTTLVWNYTYGQWYIGSPVSVAGNGSEKYLKSAPDAKISDNLGHLICWNNFVA